MSEVQNPTTTAPVAETPATEPTITTTLPESTTAIPADAPKPETTSTEAPVAESKPVESEPATDAHATATSEEKKDESAAAEKVIEPISHGQLGYKGPGLLKSLIPSKKEFWLSDDAVSPHDMNSFMRGEKQEVANPIVAWASQTGKGLLFFNKKGNTTHKSPESVLALYDATDLKKQPTHEIAFKLHAHEHVLKASSDSERDGWYMAIEKSMELGKASKEEVHESESYKAELEKLNKPHVPAAAAAAAAPKPAKKSTEAEKDEPKRSASSSDEETAKKDKKSRSTSRGLVERLKGKKEEHDIKKDEKKTDKEEEKKEEGHAAEATTAGAVGAGVVGASATATAGPDTTEEQKVEPVEKSEDKVEEKPKPAKRGSIFGRMGGFSGMKSPSKEKDAKDAELKPDVPPKDDSAPQIPAPKTEPSGIQPAVNAVDPETPAATDAKPEEIKTEDKKEEVSTPSKEKPKFLSGLSFGKRGRSVSPSQAMKEEPAKTEFGKREMEGRPVEESTEAKTAEPATENPATTAVLEGSDKPAEPTEEAKEEKTDAPANKRTSMFGNLGRRASKAFKGMQTPKKENTAAMTETKEHETTETTTDKPVVNGEHKTEEATTTEEPKKTVGDVVPEAVDDSKPQQSQAPPTVAASA